MFHPVFLCQHRPETFPVETCGCVRRCIVRLHLIIILATRGYNAHTSAYDQLPSDAVAASGHKLDELRTELGQCPSLLLQLQTQQGAPQPL